MSSEKLSEKAEVPLIDDPILAFASLIMLPYRLKVVPLRADASAEGFNVDARRRIIEFCCFLSIDDSLDPSESLPNLDLYPPSLLLSLFLFIFEGSLRPKLLTGV